MTLKRVKFLTALLRFVGLDERLRLEWISSAEAGKFTRVVTDFTEKIRSLGPNPIKTWRPDTGRDAEPSAVPLSPPFHDTGKTPPVIVDAMGGAP